MSDSCLHDDIENLCCCDCGVAFDSVEHLRAMRRAAEERPDGWDVRFMFQSEDSAREFLAVVRERLGFPYEADVVPSWDEVEP